MTDVVEVLVKTTQHLHETIREDRLAKRMDILSLAGWVLSEPEEVEGAEMEYHRETVEGGEAVLARVNQLATQGWRAIEAEKNDEDHPTLERFVVSAARIKHRDYLVRGTRTITRLMPMVMIADPEQRTMTDKRGGYGVPGYLPQDEAPQVPDTLPEDF